MTRSVEIDLKLVTQVCSCDLEMDLVWLIMVNKISVRFVQIFYCLVCYFVKPKKGFHFPLQS